MKNAVAISFLVLFFGCHTTTKLSNKNLAYVYWQEAIALHAKFKVHHISDSVSALYCSIDPNDLLFSREDDKKEFTANFIVSYKLFPSFESNLCLKLCLFHTKKLPPKIDILKIMKIRQK